MLRRAEQKCEICPDTFTPRSKVQRTCGKDVCRKALWRREHPDGEKPADPERVRLASLKRMAALEARERVVGALALMGAEERGFALPASPDELERKELAEARLRMTGSSRWCRCNGSGVYDYDRDGDPHCIRCGGRVAEVERRAARQLDPEILALMKEPWS